MKLSRIALFLILVIFISGCTDQEFKPQVDLFLDKNSITIDSGQLSDFITATITRRDNENIDTIFVLSFPEDTQSFYPTDVDGNKIREIPTKKLKGQNSLDTLQFKIFGSKNEATQASYELKLELWWNNTRIDNQDKLIRITVR